MSELVIMEKIGKLIEFSSKLNEISYKKFRNDLVTKSNYRIKGFVKLFDDARNGIGIPDDLNLSSDDVKVIEALYDKYILVLDEGGRFAKDSKLRAFRRSILDFRASVSEEEFKNVISQYPTMVQFYLTDINDDDKCATWKGMFSEKDEKVYEELIEATLKNGTFSESIDRISDKMAEESQDKPTEEVIEEVKSETPITKVEKVETPVEGTKGAKKYEAFETFKTFIKDIPDAGYNVIIEGRLPDSIKDIVKKIRSGKLIGSDLAKLTDEEHKELFRVAFEVYEHLNPNQIKEAQNDEPEKVDEFVTEAYNHIITEENEFQDQNAKQDQGTELEYQSGDYRNPGFILPPVGYSSNPRSRRNSFIRSVFSRKYNNGHKHGTGGNKGEEGMDR